MIFCVLFCCSNRIYRRAYHSHTRACMNVCVRAYFPDAIHPSEKFKSILPFIITDDKSEKRQRKWDREREGKKNAATQIHASSEIYKNEWKKKSKTVEIILRLRLRSKGVCQQPNNKKNHAISDEWKCEICKCKNLHSFSAFHSFFRFSFVHFANANIWTAGEKWQMTTKERETE